MPRQNPKRRIPSMLWEKYIGQWWKVSQMSNFQIFELLSPTKGNQVQPWIGIWTIRAPQRTMVGCVPWDVTRILTPISPHVTSPLAFVSGSTFHFHLWFLYQVSELRAASRGDEDWLTIQYVSMAMWGISIGITDRPTLSQNSYLVCTLNSHSNTPSPARRMCSFPRSRNLGTSEFRNLRFLMEAPPLEEAGSKKCFLSVVVAKAT